MSVLVIWCLSVDFDLASYVAIESRFLLCGLLWLVSRALGLFMCVYVLVIWRLSVGFDLAG